MATFVRKFVSKNFKKSSNLFTLVLTKISIVDIKRFHNGNGSSDFTRYGNDRFERDILKQIYFGQLDGDLLYDLPEVRSSVTR